MLTKLKTEFVTTQKLKCLCCDKFKKKITKRNRNCDKTEKNQLGSHKL